jgi:4-diphosphocytidyl-2-C-methyl-D-erythritol kinase
MEYLSLPSYAKINLGLLLLRKREDGYHDLATVYQQIDLYDEMMFQKTPSSIRITSTDTTIPLDETNLVHRAFRLFQERFHLRGGIKIHIRKTIPVGGGLGGGSSNAATALVAVNRLWMKKRSLAELGEMAAEIGSDVPFFLHGGTALGQGRGEILRPLQWSTDWWIVLVYPGIQISTSWAYGQVKITLTKEEKFTKFRTIFEQFSPHTLKENLTNDLEGVVLQRHPILRDLKEQMYKRDAFYASVSGSGSSVYGLFSHREQAEATRTFFSKQQRMKTFLCRPILSPSLEIVEESSRIRK